MNAEQLLPRLPSAVPGQLPALSIVSIVNRPRSIPTPALSMSKGSNLPFFHPSTLPPFHSSALPLFNLQFSTFNR
jgi:hypothetical protein